MIYFTQHWQQQQQQQQRQQLPLDGCFGTATACQLNGNESSDSSCNPSDSSSNYNSRTSSNNTSFSFDDDNCTQQRQQQEGLEHLWVVDGMYFTPSDSHSRARSAVESTTATNRGKDRRPLPSFPTSSSPTPVASTSTASALALSPPPSPTIPARPPLIRIESQELLPTRRPEVWFRRSSSSNSLCSLASRRSNISRRDPQQHQQQYQQPPEQQQEQQQQQQQLLQQQHQQSQNVVPARPLKSILKKTRPVTLTTSTSRYLAHSHLGPLLQHQYHLRLQNQQQQRQRQQALAYSQNQPSIQRRASSAHDQLSTSPPLPQYRPRPLSSPPILTTFYLPPPFPRPLPVPPRPLPTPPAAKTVHWASHSEVFFIETVEDLIDMGYFDDYDCEMGWDYRDESLDDDFSVTMDSEDEDDLGSDFDAMSERDEAEEDLESPSEDERFEYMYRRSVIERAPSFDDDDSEGEEDMEVESSVAEDELIHRMASYQLSGGDNNAMWPSLLYPPLSITSRTARSMSASPPSPFMASPSSPLSPAFWLPPSHEQYEGVGESYCNSAMWPSLLYPPLAITSRAARSMSVSPPPPPMAPPSSPLSPSFWSPPSQEQYDGVSGIIQRFQALENQNQSNGFTRFSSSSGMSSGMISPPASPSSPYPPPRRSSLTYQSIVVSKSDCGRSSSPTSSLGYLPSPSCSAPTSPNLAPAISSPIASSALKGKDGPPKSDSAQALDEVAERSRKGLGSFDSSTASTSRFGVDCPMSMVASASILLRSTQGLK